MGEVAREVEVLVHAAVAVVVPSIAGLGAGHPRALRLAAVRLVAVAVCAAFGAPCEDALRVDAQHARVVCPTATSARAAVVRVCAQVEVLVHDAVAVVVAAVTDLGAAVARAQVGPWEPRPTLGRVVAGHGKKRRQREGYQPLHARPPRPRRRRARTPSPRAKRAHAASPRRPAWHVQPAPWVRLS